MEKTLTDDSRSERERILAAVMRQLMPSPGVDAAVEAPSPEVLAALDELEKELGIDPAHVSPKLRSKLFERIAKELLEAVRRSAPEVRERLAERSSLPIKDYDIEYKINNEKLRRRGIRFAHLQRAMDAPDAVEFITPEGGDPDRQRVVLVAKRYGLADDKDSHVLLIDALAEKAKLSVRNGWRVYGSEVPLEGAVSPLQVLDRFVNVYGVVIKVGNLSPRKLFVHEVYPEAPGGSSRIMEILDAPQGTIDGSQYLRRSSLGVLEVALAYAIFENRYLHDLKQHKSL